MRLHIPVHLEKFEVISQLKKLLIEDSKGGQTTDELSSFESYLYENSLDSVKRFLMLCISEEKIGSANYDDLINYYTTKFFSFRGTLELFNLLEEIKEILGIEILSYSYTVSTLSIDFGKIETFDVNLFINSASEFFKSILYFQDYIDTIESLKLDLVSELNIQLSGGLVSYSEFNIEEEVLEDENRAS